MPALEGLRAHEGELRRLEEELERKLVALYERLRGDIERELDRGGARGLVATLPGLGTRARSEALGISAAVTLAAEMLARRYAERELGQAGAAVRYGENAPGGATLLVHGAMTWLDAALGMLLAEAAQLALTNAPPDVTRARLVVDGETRLSVWGQGLSRAAFAATNLVWATANATRTATYRAADSATGWQRQAIAALDERTTECCLRVHGQIVGLDEPFKLTGTPRFADEMMIPPFHHYCRTSVVLYESQMETLGVPTATMQAAAAAELSARHDGSRVEIHPAHSTSRRAP